MMAKNAFPGALWIWMACGALCAAEAGTLSVAKSGGRYATVQAGLAAANPGDTVLVKAGVYNEAVSFGKSGTASGPITLLGETGAILDGTGVGGEEMVSIESKSYVRVIGFEVRNLKKAGTPIGISVSGGGSHIEIRRNHVHHIENANGNAHGIAVYGTSAAPIADLIVDGNEIDACKLGQSESMVLNGNVSGFIVSNNVVHDNDNIGIDFIGFEGVGPDGQDQARNGHCHGNRVYNISSAANPTYGGERSADGIMIIGNTTWQGGNGEIVLQHNCRNVAIKNNILAAKAGGAYLEESGKGNTGIVADNNLYFGAGTSSPGSWSDAHALFADPKLMNAPTDLHIRAGSPAIDAGAALGAALAGTQDVDGDSRVGGAKPDVGADESNTNTGLRAGSGRPGLTGYRADGYRTEHNALGRKSGDNPEITPRFWRNPF